MAAAKEGAAAPAARDGKDKLPHEHNGFVCSALGKQAQSQRETIPTHKISTVSRQHVEKVFISEGHTRTAKIGRESPKGGPIYKNESTLGGVSFGFGTAKRDITTLKRTSANQNRPGEFFLPPNEDKDDIPTNDALGCLPDTQKVKYSRDPQIIMGTEPRGKLKDAFLLKAHPAAFAARESPGPAACGGEFGPRFEATKPQLAPARQFGARTQHKGTNWMRFGDNPDEVGPGRHERKDNSLGQQHLTQRRNQPVNKFTQAPKFARDRSEDTISKLDNAKSSFGRQSLAKNKSAPVINFNMDSRDTRSRTMLCMTSQDKPAMSMPKFVAPQPPLPMDRHVMRSGFG